jgi:hypothetical protein
MCHLQELYAKYADKGLMVLGFNASDDKKIALEMMHANGVTFPNVIDSSDAATKVCFQKYQGAYGSAVPMSYIIDRDGKVVAAWYGYDEGEPRAIAALKKTGGELAAAIRGDAKVARSAKAVAADAKRLFDAIRAADYDRDWMKEDAWKRFPAEDVDYRVDRDAQDWVRWVCQKFKANPIADVQLGKVFAGPTGAPTVHFELRLKDGETLKGDLPFSWDTDRKQWVGQKGLDWHLQKKP